jgi:hypothetical protein
MVGFADDSGGSGRGGVAAGGDVLEVGVFEAGWVFEAVAKEAVEGYVGCPDEGCGGGWMPVLEVAEEEEGEWEGEGVDEVVGRGPDAGVEEVAEHEEVGGEEEDGEEEPAVVEVLVKENGADKEAGFFNFEQESRAIEH